MNQFFQFLQNIPIQAYVVFGIFAISMLGSVAKKVGEVKQKRAIELERQRRANESMRTGRPIPDAKAEQAQADEARQNRLAEMQQRRQAQMDELRKRRQAMLDQQAARQQAGRPQTARPQASAAPAPPPTPTPARSLGVLQSSKQARRPTPTSTPVHTSRAHPGSHQVSRAAGLSAKRSTGSTPHATIHASNDLEKLRQHHLQGKLEVKSQAVRDKAHPYGSPMQRHGITFKNQHDLRRAIILSEILAKPVSQRTDRIEEFS